MTNNNGKKLNADEWSTMWDAGSITTFGGMFDSNYDSEFLEFWKNQLEQGQWSHLADLCCGNGALSWIANDICNAGSASTKVTGVDIARIDPFKTLQRKKTDYPEVEFVGDTSIDELPFSDQSLDIAVSQYGIEYANTSKVVSELGRVLTQKSKLVFIMHSHDSDLLLSTLSSAGKYEYILGEGRFHELLLELDTLYNSKKNPQQVAADPDVRSIQAKIQKLIFDIQTMDNKSAGAENNRLVLSYMKSVLSLFEDLSKFKNRKRSALIEQGIEIVKDTLARMYDLKSAALSEESYKELVGQIENLGYSVERRGHFLIGGKKMGYVLVAERNDS